VQEKRSVPRYSGPEARALNRIIVSPRDVQLLDLENYARSRQYVNVELSGLLRLSPAAAQALVRLFNPWLQRGKTVRLIRPQLLVEALLSTLCLDPRVELIRAQLS
jgi:hypothetical protein